MAATPKAGDKLDLFQLFSHAVSKPLSLTVKKQSVLFSAALLNKILTLPCSRRSSRSGSLICAFDLPSEEAMLNVIST